MVEMWKERDSLAEREGNAEGLEKEEIRVAADEKRGGGDLGKKEIVWRRRVVVRLIGMEQNSEYIEQVSLRRKSQ